MRSVRISAKTARVLVDVPAKTRTSPALERYELEAFEELRRALVVKPAVRERRRARETQRANRNADTSQLRGILELRAKGRCEECNYHFSAANPAELDHFFGRSKVLQSVSNCWLLCRSCHRAKTANRPDACRWLERFIRHCDRYGFKAEAWAATARLEALRMLPKGVR